jgi:pantoate--beta-alanine ligase
MGYFHQGHLSLMEAGRKQANLLVVSLFVNPLQFAPGEDLERYPRDFERDARLAREVGVDILFCPEGKDLYPEDFQTHVTVEKVTRNLCGASRPGHFQGVATVVCKLFNIVKPHLALFGQKDFQQLVAIRQMVRDLNMDLEVVGLPTVREADGLAMSSRNVYLSPEERIWARSLSQALEKAQDLVREGERRPESVLVQVRAWIQRFPGATIDYARIVDPETLEELQVVGRQGLLALAVFVGKTRLIDNCLLEG